jgi:membrane protein DedA with SNARE-associated domain
MTSLIDHLLHSYGYYAVFLFIALESLGIPLPGESTLIAAAVYAGATHHLDIRVVFAVAAAASIIGDNAGYWLGRTGGQRLVQRFGRYVRLDAAKLRVGRYLFDRHGGKVVFYGRFVSVLRTYAAFFAGLNRMRWRRFLAFNAGGGLVWSAVYAFGAFGLGTAATSVGSVVTYVGLALTAVLTVAAIVFGRRKMRDLERLAEPDPAEVPAPAPELAGVR